MATITDDANSCVRRGMQQFREGKVAESLEEFAAAMKKDPRIEPYLWQQGISQYYAKQYAEGRRHFELHRVVNPHDVENAAWHFLCVAQVDGLSKARRSLIEIDTARDSRIPLAQVYALYAGDGSAAEILAAAAEADSAQATMYAHLYLGLYYEVAGEPAKAETHLRQAVAAKLENVYMHEVAKVHMQQRNWMP